jgi:ABC-2 type transport system permease protein
VLLTNMTFQNMMSFISFQAMTGMLEQLYLSPYSFTWLAFGKMLGSLFYSLTLYVPVLFLMMLTTGQWLHLDLLSIFPLILLLTAQAYGMGFMMGGLALLYKQINALGQPVVMLLVLFIAAPPDLAPFVRFVPFNVGWRLLRDVMADGVPIWQLPTWDLALVAIQAAVLCWGGWLVYRWCEEIARQRGVLGQY